MLSALPSLIIMPCAFLLFCLNLAFCGSMVFIGGIFKFLLPFKLCQRAIYRLMHGFYYLWAFNNVLIVKLFNNVEWEVEGNSGLNKQSWYLLIANHQSWLDIVVLADFARANTPLPKFFLKESLKKVPFLGMACWALDMPFMKRYSRKFIEKHPELKGQDIETTRKSCQSFQHNPTTIINFVEGTRFTSKKHTEQKSLFNLLLKPKAGGIAFTLAALGERFDKLLNVTVVYPESSNHIMKDVLKGRLTKVVIIIEQINVQQQLIGDYFNDEQFKISFQHWLNDIWQEKDRLMLSTYRKHQLNHPTKPESLSDTRPLL